MSASPVLLAAARSTPTSEDTALVRRVPHAKKAIQQRRYAPKTRTGNFVPILQNPSSLHEELPHF
jgi:hypothetical protein